MRPDVERILGKPSAERNNWSIYDSEAETISGAVFKWASLRFGGANSEWKVSKGTVISITVAPRTIIPEVALRITENEYQKQGDPPQIKSRGICKYGERGINQHSKW